MTTSSTRNIKLGVCRVSFDGKDLGLTQGGVEVSVATETHKVNVDQFGKTTVNEYVMGRTCSVKVPMAETTLDNMVRIMPGATLTETGGAQATGTITFSGAPTDGDTVTVAGVTFTAKTSPNGEFEFGLGSSATTAAASLLAKLQGTSSLEVQTATYAAAAGVITATFVEKGLAGNAFTLAKSGTAVTLSGATLTGGTEPTSRYVEVTHGIGQDLLATAKELRLHPTAKAVGDTTDDFVIPLANTGGALNFAYKLDAERIFNVEFTGYPDPVTGKLYFVGNKP